MVDDTANPHPQYHHPLYHHQQHELGDVVVDNDHDDEEDEKCFMKLLSSGPTFDIGQTAIIAGELSKALPTTTLTQPPSQQPPPPNDENAKLRVCAQCMQPIYDRFIYCVLAWHFHEHCVRCADCSHPLAQSCYVRPPVKSEGESEEENTSRNATDLLFCREHFLRRYGPKCSHCGEILDETCQVRRASNHIYHVNCLRCAICKRELKTGDQFHLIPANGLVVCQPDFEAAAKENEDNNNSKRPRTTISAKNMELLRQAYQRSSKPPRHVREQLAAQTGLDMRVVQVWFQNRRAKEKRLKRDVGGRRSHGGGTGTGSGGSGSWTTTVMHNGGGGNGGSDSGSMHDRTGTTVDSDSGGSPNDSESLMGGGTGGNTYLDLETTTPSSLVDVDMHQQTELATFTIYAHCDPTTSGGGVGAPTDNHSQQQKKLILQQEQQQPPILPITAVELMAFQQAAQLQQQQPAGQSPLIFSGRTLTAEAGITAECSGNNVETEEQQLFFSGPSINQQQLLHHLQQQQQRQLQHQQQQQQFYQLHQQQQQNT